MNVSHRLIPFMLLFAYACAASPKADQARTTPISVEDPARTAPLLEGMGNLHWAISSDSE